MMVMDIGINVVGKENIDSFVSFAQKIGYVGIAVSSEIKGPAVRTVGDFTVARRIDLTGKGLNSLKRQIKEARKNCLVVAIPLGAIETMNWAAEDQRVDLLTLEPSKDYRLRDTTAHLATSSSTFLEVKIAPLLSSTGLERSRILKAYREAVRTAIDAKMGIVISSGASSPIGLRSPVAMMHIGMLLGLDRTAAKQSVTELPARIIEKNRKKSEPGFVRAGVEILSGGKDT